MPENPLPNGIRQRTSGPSFGQRLRSPVSRELPSRCGPRHCDHSEGVFCGPESLPATLEARYSCEDATNQIRSSSVFLHMITSFEAYLLATRVTDAGRQHRQYITSSKQRKESRLDDLMDAAVVTILFTRASFWRSIMG